MKKRSEKAYLAGGCFWCLEAVFGRLKGVEKVTSGYAGGTVVQPTSEQVSSGRTGHAETVEISYDEAVVDYQTLLKVFFSLHDPTTLNRQGNDVGTQYRSVIFYTDEKQKKQAQTTIKKLTKEKVYPDPIVTELKPFEAFYPAEPEQQKYFQRNPEQAYCQYVIAPKVTKLKQSYQHLLKK